MRRRQRGGRRERQRWRRCQDEAGERVERTAHRTRVMFVVLVGLAVRLTISADQRQNMALGIFTLGVSAALRRPEHLGEVESKVDGDQRVKGEREEAEPRGPNTASPPPHLNSDRPVNEGLERCRADAGAWPCLEKASGALRPARAAKAPQRPCLRRRWRACYIFMPPIAAAFSTVTVTSSFPAFSKVSVSGKLSPTFSGCLRPTNITCRPPGLSIV